MSAVDDSVRMGASRRGFLQGVGAVFAASALGGCQTALSLVDALRRRAMLGVVANSLIDWPKSTFRLQKALRCFQYEGVDAVLLMGEVTKDGFRDQYAAVAEAWGKVFDKRWPALFVVQGPHEAKAFEHGAAASLEELGARVVGPDGGDFTVGDWTFAAAHRKSYGRSDTVSFRAVGEFSLTDEMCVHPVSARSVHVGSLSGISDRPGFEGGEAVASASQGLVVRAYSDRVEIARLDFTQNSLAPGEPLRDPRPPASAWSERIAPDWVIPLAGEVDGEQRQQAPQFPERTRLVVVPGFDWPRIIYTIRWPSVLARHTGTRAAFYELLVKVDGEGHRPPAVRKYLRSAGWYLAEARDTEALKYVLYDEDVVRQRGQAMTVSVTPVSSTGLRGAPLSAVIAGRQ